MSYDSIKIKMMMVIVAAKNLDFNGVFNCPLDVSLPGTFCLSVFFVTGGSGGATTSEDLRAGAGFGRSM